MAKKKNNTSADKVWGLTRIGLGFVFLWAFFDKLIGLGFATCKDSESGAVNIMCNRAWLEDGSPTSGFLKGVDGPFADFYQGLANNAFIDWLFMLGLLGVGLALIFGIGMRIATVSGALMLIMMYTAALPLANNPIVDDHIIYALVLIGLLKQNDTQALGFGDRWKQTDIVKKYPILA